MNDLPDRRKLTFAQAEGLDPLPTQLKRGEVSRELRAKLWAYVYKVLEGNYRSILRREGRWYGILADVHVEHFHGRIDKFNQNGILDWVGTHVFERGDYVKLYGWLDFVLKHDSCPADFRQQIGRVLEECRSAYRVIDGVIWPVASQEEKSNIESAMAALSTGQFSGARTHLRNAASNLSHGKYAESVRESISAVESVARILEPTGDFSKALLRLESKVRIHSALKKGIVSLYGYTSDEKGIRHALLSDEGADVDETDAIFFIGACAAFVTYLVNKSRASGLVQ